MATSQSLITTDHSMPGGMLVLHYARVPLKNLLQILRKSRPRHNYKPRSRASKIVTDKPAHPRSPQWGCGAVIRIVLHKDIPNLRNQAVAQVCAPYRDRGFECNRGNLKLTGDVLLLGLGWV